jgi:hypothetical protein
MMLLGCIGVTLGATSTVEAQATVSLDSCALDYAAPAVCPDAARLGDEISARLGYPAVSASSERRARVRVFVDGPEFTAVVQMDDGPARSVRSNDCTDLVATVGSMLATELDAGAPAPALAAAAPERPPADGRVRLRVEAEEELVLHEMLGTSTAVVYGAGTTGYGVAMHYGRICVAPCEAEIAPGTHRLAIARGMGEPWLVDGYTTVDADSVLHLSYVSREGERIAGFITLISGLLVPIPLVAGGIALRDHYIDADGYGYSEVSGGGWALFTVGVGICVAALATGLYYLFRGDSANVDVEPWTF